VLHIIAVCMILLKANGWFIERCRWHIYIYIYIYTTTVAVNYIAQSCFTVISQLFARWHHNEDDDWRAKRPVDERLRADDHKQRRREIPTWTCKHKPNDISKYKNVCNESINRLINSHMHCVSLSAVNGNLTAFGVNYERRWLHKLTCILLAVYRLFTTRKW